MPPASIGFSPLGGGGAPSATRLFAAGDIDDNSATTTNTAAHLNSLMTANPTARFLAIGDLTYPSGVTSEYTRYNNRFAGIKSRTIPAPGNHEYQQPANDAAAYRNYFSAIYGSGPIYYRMVLDASWVVYSLNAEIPFTAGSAQGVWLQTALEAETLPGRIFLMHHPYRTSDSVNGLDRVQTHFVNMARTHNISLILSGNSHSYERFDLDTGVRQIVVGTGGHSQSYAFGTIATGSQVRSNTVKGFLQLDLTPTNYSWLFLPVSGSFTDSGTTVINT